MKNLKKQWEALKPEDQQMVGMMAALTGSLFMRGILRHNAKKNEKEIVKLIVPKNAEVFIFVKGGK